MDVHNLLQLQVLQWLCGYYQGALCWNPDSNLARKWWYMDHNHHPPKKDEGTSKIMQPTPSTLSSQQIAHQLQHVVEINEPKIINFFCKKHISHTANFDKMIWLSLVVYRKSLFYLLAKIVSYTHFIRCCHRFCCGNWNMG